MGIKRCAGLATKKEATHNRRIQRFFERKRARSEAFARIDALIEQEAKPSAYWQFRNRKRGRVETE